MPEASLELADDVELALERRRSARRRAHERARALAHPVRVDAVEVHRGVQVLEREARGEACGLELDGHHDGERGLAARRAEAQDAEPRGRGGGGGALDARPELVLGELLGRDDGDVVRLARPVAAVAGGAPRERHGFFAAATLQEARDFRVGVGALEVDGRAA